MSISRERLTEIAGNFIQALDEMGIYNLSDLDEKRGQWTKSEMEKDENSKMKYVLIHYEDRHDNIMVRSILYCEHGFGIPMGFEINDREKRTRAFLRCQSMVGDYYKYGWDSNGNLLQEKFMDDIEIDMVRNELESLI